jgi:sulfite reductase alpha subunit-like flavoprotein
LTAADAAKRTLAVQLELPPGATYRPGDAIALVCPNDDAMVDALLARLGLDGHQGVTVALRDVPEAAVGALRCGPTIDQRRPTQTMAARGSLRPSGVSAGAMHGA